MRGGAQVKEALGYVTLLWNHPVLTGLLLLIFTPPFFSLVVYFSPVLISTALCVVALVSVGSQMEKIKSEGGPGQQLETRLGRDYGVSTWMPPRDHTRSDQAPRYYGESNHHHRNLYANIHVVPAPPSWTDGRNNTATAQLRPVEDDDPVTPAAAESDEDWLDTWVKEYESRPGWGEQQDQQPLRTPAAILTSTTSQAPALSTLARKESAPLKRDVRDENRPDVRIAASVPAPVVAAPVAAPVAVSVVMNRQDVASRRLVPPPPTTSTSRNLKEVVVSVRVTDFHPLAPIRTGKETTRDRQVDRVGKTAQEILAVPVKVEVPAERVSNVQALQSINKLLHTEMGEPQSVASVADVKNANPKAFRVTSPGFARAPGKGVGVETSEKTQSTTAADIAGETPLLRHLKTSRSKKHSRSSSAFSPLPQRASRGGVMAEKVLPPPQFSPRLLQSLQPLPPKGLSPRPLPNLSTAPLGNPVEKIPQWVYDGIPKERAAKQATKSETAEEKHVRAFEQAVKVLSYTRRRTHARRPLPIQVDFADALQESESPRTTPSVDRSTERSSRRTSPHRPASRASSPHKASPTVPPSELLPCRIPEDLTAARAPHKPAVAHALPVPSASATPPPRTSPQGALPAAAAAASPSKALLARTASSPQPAPIAAASLRASSPRTATIATSPRPAPTPQKVPLAGAPPPGASGTSSLRNASTAASSPQKAPNAASPRLASRASSPRIGSSPCPASVASPSPQMRTPSPPRRPSVPSVPSSPSLPHPRRHKQQSSKLGLDKVASPSSIRIKGSTYYDTPPGVEKEDSTGEDYVPIEKEMPSVVVVVDANCEEGNAVAALHYGRSSRRSSNSRRRLEPRRVVTSEDADIFCLPMRNGETVKYVDSSSTTDDERESVTPTTSRRLVRRTIKPLVWRSRSVQAHDDSD